MLHSLKRRQDWFRRTVAGGGVLLLLMVLVCVALGLQGCSAWQAAFDPVTGEPTPKTQTLTGSAIGLLSAINPILGVVATGLVGTASAVAVAQRKKAINTKDKANVIVDSFEAAKKKHPEFKAALEAAKETISKVQKQTPGVEEMVAKAQATSPFKTV